MIARCDLVLVSTSNPENLGGVARVMENFGVTSALHLVAPRVPPDDHRALVVGRAALDRLSSARVVGTIAEAVEGASYVVGFSARRGADRPSLGLRRLAAHLGERAPGGRVALVFGPEDTGLLREHIEACDVTCVIETPGPLASLNLTQAVTVALWELSRPGEAAKTEARAGATRAEVEAFLNHAFEALAAIGYLREGEEERKRVHLRRVLGASGLSSVELRGLHGICEQVIRVVGHARENKES